jgi:NAD(P)-dependent dehydrogenase (short-subunit alcohol dehydrogenase family)
MGDVRDELTNQTADAINATLGASMVLAVHLDVTCAADWRGAVETCEREFGGLDILVNSAGIANMKGLDSRA